VEKISDKLFLVEGNCFNKETLEVFSLEPMYMEALKLLTSKDSIPNNLSVLCDEICSSGLLGGSGNDCSEKQKIFLPKFVAFRIVLGEVCNLSCSNCFVLERQHQSKKMTKDNMVSIIENTFSYGKSINIKYQFFGGEPLLMFDLIEIAVKMIEDAVVKKLIQEPIIAITTNGMLINDSLASFFRQHKIKVGISIDGPKEKNDVLRGNGVFDKACESFSVLQKNNVECWFLVTLYEQLLDILPDFLRWLSGKFCFSTITFNTPFDGKTVKWMTDGYKFADTLLECCAIAKQYGFSIEGAGSPVLYALSSKVKRTYPCSISGKDVMASIAPDGRISFCAQYWGDDLFKEKFVDGFNLMWQQEKPLICNICVAENICGGPCFVNYEKTNEMDKEKCRFYKRFLEKLLENPYLYLTEHQIEKENV